MLIDNLTSDFMKPLFAFKWMILNRSNIINNYTEYFPFIAKSYLLNYDELSINQFKSNHGITYITYIIELYEKQL